MANSAPVFTLGLVDCKTKDGNAARFVCRVTAIPVANIQWYKDDKLLKESHQFSFLQDSSSCTLIITQSKECDVGLYKCVATNSLGSVSSSARLIIKEFSDVDDDEDDQDCVTDENAKPVEITRGKAAQFYAMKDEIGRGKFGIVRKCIDVKTGKEYAAKFISSRSKSARDEILHEVEVMNELNHKRLLRLQAVFDGEKEIVLIMELITGGELFEKLVQEEFISEATATLYIKQLLDGLEHMHSNNILHLDLKPENMMLIRPGSKHIKIIDYGLARKYDPNTKLQVMQGTPEFAAPEIVSYECITPATDVWAVGVITYVVLSGLSPFLGDNDGETMSNISKMLWDFDDPVFDDMTDEGKDFISRILIKDSSKRMTLSECQKHPWLRVKSNKKLETQRLKTFTARRKWKKALTAVRSTNFLSRILNKSAAAKKDGGPAAGKGAFLAKIKQQIAAENTNEDKTEKEVAPHQEESTPKVDVNANKSESPAKEEENSTHGSVDKKVEIAPVKQESAKKPSETVSPKVETKVESNVPTKDAIVNKVNVSHQKSPNKNAVPTTTTAAAAAGKGLFLNKIKQTGTKNAQTTVDKNVPKKDEVSVTKVEKQVVQNSETALKNQTKKVENTCQSNKQTDQKHVGATAAGKSDLLVTFKQQAEVKHSTPSNVSPVKKSEPVAQKKNQPQKIVPTAGKPVFLAQFKPQAEVKSTGSTAGKAEPIRVENIPKKQETDIKKDELVTENAKKVNGCSENEAKASEESFFIEQLQDQEVAKWSALTLTVKINHSGAKPKITWKKDGKTVSTGRPKMAYDKGVATLKYTRVELADSGKYTVEIDTGKQKHDSSATVKVGDQSKSKTTNVPAAGKSALFANFKQQSAAQSSNASDNKITVEVKENAAQSEGNVQKTEANIATEKEVETESAESKKKQVNGGNAKGDSLFIEQLQDQQAKKWSAVTLTAKINDGVTKPKITWKKDGKPLGAGRARMTYDKGVATLKYPRIEYTDSGKYIVEVDTGSEKCESGATIEVADIPEPPFPPNAAEIKSTSMKVSWRASNTGNSPITSYVLEYRANSDKDWVPVTGDVTTTSYLLEDLTPKTQYRFRVSATNKLGTSKPSRTSNVFQSKA